MKRLLISGLLLLGAMGAAMADNLPTVFCWHGVCDIARVQMVDAIPTPLPPKLPPIVVSPQNFDEAPPVIQMAAPKQTVLLGDYAGAALEWLLPILAPIVAGFIVDALLKLRAFLGQSTSDAQRDKLQQMAENGVNLAAHSLSTDLKGTVPIQTRSQAMALAVDYVQAHGADTLKALGMDPTDPKTVQGLQGRVATILANKSAGVQPVVTTAPAA